MSLKIQVKTKRLLLRPMTDEAMQAMIDAETDPELKVAYGEMLAGARARPSERLWYTAWCIAQRDGVMVGDLCFKGVPKGGAVEIGYGILAAYRGNGFATEAVKAITAWAFAQDGVYFVTAETEPHNAISRRVLERVGFRPDGMGAEGPRFAKEKPPANWMLMYMALGMGVGASFGASSDSLALGVALGMCIGIALGITLDTQEKKKRDALRTARETNRIHYNPPA